jgi:two-component system, cell cycle response regulator
MKLLIADDDVMSRTTLAAMAESWGFDPICAEDGEAAWDIIQEQYPPLLLLDWEMPRLHGVDLCARIGEQCKEGQLPYIIMLTANNHVDDMVKGLDMGANDYISKPYHMMELKARLNVGKRMVKLQQELLDAKGQLELLVSVDDLTGVGNRRSFNRRIEDEWSRAMRRSERISVAFIDIDHFKKYNDLYGHLAGDVCLRAVAQEISSVMKRSMDFFARYGGEEFALILSETSHLECVLESCRLAVENLLLAHEETEPGVVTVSLGGASLIPSPDGLTRDEFLKKVDDELYQSKAEGRNRVSVVDLDQ